MKHREHFRIRKIALMISLAALLTAALPFSAYADSKQTEQQLNKAKEAAQQTQQAIDQNEENIDSLNDTKSALEDQKSDLEGQLSTLNESLTEAADKLSEIEAKIDSKNDEIDSTNKELEEAEEKAESQYESMKRRIQFMYEKGSTYPLEMLLSAGTFGDLLNRKNYIERVEEYDRKMLKEYQQTQADIEDKKAKLEQEKSDLEDLKQDAEAEQNRVSELVSSTKGSISAADSSISQYVSAISNAEDLGDQLGDVLDQQNEDISALEKQLAEERRLEALSNQSVWRSIGDVTFSDSDRTLLANLIYCEAGAEPYEGQMAVGAVVVNRVLSGAFPSTVVGVIYQSGQFSPVSNGHLAAALAADLATDSCYQAADAAISGQTNVGNCIFFRTPIPQVTPKYTIGGHIFY